MSLLRHRRLAKGMRKVGVDLLRRFHELPVNMLLPLGLGKVKGQHSPRAGVKAAGLL